jgi:uncharacterized membrane protein YfhO
VEASDRSLVVISQAFYHPWKAFVDGVSTPIFKANGAFQAVEVPQGRHRVRLIYRDKTFVIGSIVSLAAAVICSFVWWRGKTRQQ